MHYAYTGRLVIDEDTIDSLFLLAQELKCNQIIDWCVDYIRPR